MEHSLAWLALISIIVAVDNALLAGIILPYAASGHKKNIMVAVGIILCVSQIGISIGVERLLHEFAFQILAFSILAWMSIRTMTTANTMYRAAAHRFLILKVSFYTVFGNLDNMIWLGAELRFQHEWLIFFSIATIPLFILVALFLSNQSEQHEWILFVGAGMMAWAASAIVTQMPVRQFHDILDYRLFIQIGISSLILTAGLITRKLSTLPLK